MYKVVLVDDESIIVEGLSRMMPWETYDCEVVGMAHDVVSGRQMIDKYQPDILFTDIRMPDGDGLTMLAGLKSEHPRMQVTVLTGYRDFNYAQQAITLGVSRFLLKPSKMTELEEALAVMVEALGRLQTIDEAREKSHEDGDTVSNFVVREAVSYIEEHYAEKLTLLDIADACFVSQWHLSKLFSKYLGQTFYDLLNTARINAAKELLENPSLRIGEVATEVGYAGISHFSRVFKKAEGISPNEYRNQKETTL